MPEISQALYVKGAALPPYVGDWQLLSSKRYPDAEFSWDDARLITAEAETGEELSLEEALDIELLIRQQIIEDGGGPLESRIYSRVERSSAGETLITYRVQHAAHGSPILWVPVIALIAANWKAILITMGLIALAGAITTFAIKSVSIIWKGGGKVEDFIEGAPPALIAGLGAGLLLLLVIVGLGTRKKESAA